MGTRLNALARRVVLLATIGAAFLPTAASGQLSPRYGHSAIYDPVRQRMVIFGGTKGATAFSNDVWQFSLAGDPMWSELLPDSTPPSERQGQSAIYDPVRDRMVIFGGVSWQSPNVVSLDDVWALSLADSTWHQLHPTGPGPSPRWRHSAIYDPVRDRMLIYGGSDYLGGLPFSDVWSLEFSPTLAWRPMGFAPSSSAPLARDRHSAIYDSGRGRMLVFGGDGFSDVWSLSLVDSTWTEVHPSGDSTLFPVLSSHSAIYDPNADRMVVFGGVNQAGNYGNDVWNLSLGDPPAWSVILATGESPSARAASVAVYDARYQRMLVFGGSPQADNESTWGFSLQAPLRWIPWRSKIDVSPPGALTLKTVTVGDTSWVAFSVSNVGLRPLHVAALDSFPAPGMRLSAPPPFDLAWNQTVADTLFLAGTAPDSARSTLVLTSNDPEDPLKAVLVDVHVLDLAFGTRVLGSPSEAPLGVPFDVVVTPQPGVHVERGQLFFRVAGAPVFDSVPLISLSTDFIATVPAPVVTERGVEYYVEVENSGFVTTQPSAAPAAVDTQRVARPASITPRPRPASGSDFLAGNDILVDVLLPPGANFVSGAIHYRRGGEVAWKQAALAMDALLEVPSAVIPDSMVGPRGVEYWIETTTTDTTLRAPPTEGASNVIPIRVRDLVEPSSHESGRYRLLSIPLDFDADPTISLYDLLADQVGTPDPVRWRAYSFDAAAQRTVELSLPAPASFHPEPGRAFWLITRGAHRVDTRPIDGFSTPTGPDRRVALALGWNLIGNPFDFPVAWDDVGRDTLHVGTPIGFNPTLGTIGDYDRSFAPSALVPFEGYFLYADRPETLSVPPREAPADLIANRWQPVSRGWSSIPSASQEGGANLWRLRLEARTDQAVDGSNDFGTDAGALEGFDPLDGRKPPPSPGPWVRVAFTHPDWGERSGEYRRDLRRPGSDGETWEVEVRSATPGEVVTVQLSPERAPGQSLVVRLIDREQGTLTDAWTMPSSDGGMSYPIVSFGSARTYRLAIVAGTSDYVARTSGQALSVPAEVALEPSAPNPFRVATRIRFGQPGNEAVTFEIYDVLGHRMATLLDRAPLTAGHHSVVWDGRTQAGGTAPSGVYLMRLVVGRATLTRRLVRIR